MRALGDNSTLEIDLKQIELNPQDEQLFFLCTDGVTTVVNDTELEEILIEHDNVKETLSNLIEQRGAPDNFSYVVITKNTNG
jgi:protein phosphatase